MNDNLTQFSFFGKYYSIKRGAIILALGTLIMAATLWAHHANPRVSLKEYYITHHGFATVQGRIIPPAEDETLARGAAIVEYRVAGTTYRKTINLRGAYNRPAAWPLLMVYDPADPTNAFSAYETRGFTQVAEYLLMGFMFIGFVLVPIGLNFLFGGIRIKLKEGKPEE